jgi:hypothetical protein
LTNGWTVAFKAGFSNTSSCTMNVDSLGAKSIHRLSGTSLLGGEIKSGAIYTITYHQPIDAWMLHSAANGDAFASGTAIVFYQASAPTGWTAVAQNNKALRVVSAGGTGGTAGGTTAFTSVFTSRTIAQANLPIVNFTVTGTAASHTHDPGTLAASHSHAVGTLGVDAHSHAVGTLAVDSHTHASGTLGGTSASDGAHTHSVPGGGGTQTVTAGGGSAADTAAQTTGSGGAHTHTITLSTGATAGSTATISGSTATGTATISGSTASTAPTFTGATAASGTLNLTATAASGGSATALDFAVQYIDVIVATKD